MQTAAHVMDLHEATLSSHPQRSIHLWPHVIADGAWGHAVSLATQATVCLHIIFSPVLHVWRWRERY